MRRWRGLGVCVSLCLLVIACGGTEQSADTAETPDGSTAEGEVVEYQIGTILSVTGNFAFLGDPELKAVQLRIDEANELTAETGARFEVVDQDDESLTDQAVLAANRLCDNGVTALVGPSVVETVNAIAPVAESCPMVSYMLTPAVTPDPDSYMFGTWMSSRDSYEKVAQWLTESGRTKMAILADTTSSGETALSINLELADEYGIETSVERFNQADTDVDAQLINLQAFEPDALLALVTGEKTAMVVNGFNRLGLDIPFIATTGNLSQDFIDLIAGNEPDELILPGLKIVAGESLSQDDPAYDAVQAFRANYQEAYGSEPDVYAATAYDAADALVSAMLEVGEDPDAIRSYLESLGEFHGVSGTYRLSDGDHRGSTPDAVILVEVKDGAFHAIDG